MVLNLSRLKNEENWMSPIPLASFVTINKLHISYKEASPLSTVMRTKEVTLLSFVPEFMLLIRDTEMPGAVYLCV